MLELSRAAEAASERKGLVERKRAVAVHVRRRVRVLELTARFHRNHFRSILHSLSLSVVPVTARHKIVSS